MSLRNVADNEAVPLSTELGDAWNEPDTGKPPCDFCRREIPCECGGATCMCTCGRCMAGPLPNYTGPVDPNWLRGRLG